MSWLETLGEVAALGGVPSAARSYVRGQLISAGVRAGQSANEIIRGLRSVGAGFQRTQALSAIRAESARQMAGATSAQVDLTLPVDQLLGTAAPENWTGQFVHQVAVTWRERDEEGNYSMHAVTKAIKSSQLLTPGEAVAGVYDIMTQNPEAPQGGTPGIDPSSIVAMSLSGVWYDTQRRNLPFVQGGRG